MSVSVLVILLAAAAVMMVIESRGIRTTLQLSFKGDVKRETAFLAQWGQSVSTPLAALIVWQLDPPRRRDALLMIGGVLAASLMCFIVKRLCGRVRPNRENAGKFLGPSLKHANYRESFPSSHSACAIALSIYLATLYPAAAPTFWFLGLMTALLRYVMDAHFPSDVLGGVAIGYFNGWLAVQAATRWLSHWTI
ncbi:MAG: phosphatase PAP2 family protein [Phycisphaerae bacterium]|nr:phosphatase PAP2 family protein [Phycisphaerae bacterium]